MELPPIIDTVEITARPVTLHEVMDAARMGNWSDRRMLFLHPWPENADNIRMWLLIGMVCILGVSLVIGASADQIPFIVTAITLSLFSIGIVYVFQITSGLSARLALRVKIIQNALREQLQKSVDHYGTEVVNGLKEATGRSDLKSDPISVAAAIISLTKKNRTISPTTKNPFRALLDGTLQPRDITPLNEDDDEFLDY